MDKETYETKGQKPIQVSADEKFTDEELLEVRPVFAEILAGITEQNISGRKSSLEDVTWNATISIHDWGLTYAKETTVAEHLTNMGILASKIFNYLAEDKSLLHAVGVPAEEYNDENWKSSRYLDVLGVVAGVFSANITASALAAVRDHPIARQAGPIMDTQPVISYLQTLTLHRAGPELSQLGPVTLLNNYTSAVTQITVSYLESRRK